MNKVEKSLVEKLLKLEAKKPYPKHIHKQAEAEIGRLRKKYNYSPQSK